MVEGGGGVTVRGTTLAAKLSTTDTNIFPSKVVGMKIDDNVINYTMSEGVGWKNDRLGELIIGAASNDILDEVRGGHN